MIGSYKCNLWEKDCSFKIFMDTAKLPSIKSEWMYAQPENAYSPFTH